jgi:hypothetical protein
MHNVLLELRPWCDYEVPAPDLDTAISRMKLDVQRVRRRIAERQFELLKAELHAVAVLGEDLVWIVRASLASSVPAQRTPACSPKHQEAERPVLPLDRKAFRKLVEKAEDGGSAARTRLRDLLGAALLRWEDLCSEAAERQQRLLRTWTDSKLGKSACQLLDDGRIELLQGSENPLAHLSVESALLCQVEIWLFDLWLRSRLNVLLEVEGDVAQLKDSASDRKQAAMQSLAAAQQLDRQPNSPLRSDRVNKRMRRK